QDRGSRPAVLGLEAGRGKVAPLVILDRRVDGVAAGTPYVTRHDRRGAEDLLVRWERPQIGDRVDVDLMGELGQLLLALAFSVPPGDGQVDERFSQLRHGKA